MKFQALATYLDRLEATPKRLELTSILAELIAKTPILELDKVIYFTLGYLKAPFARQNFTLADRMMTKALALAYKKEPANITHLFTQTGDLGDVVYQIAPKTSTTDPGVLEVHTRLMAIAQAEGTGSQEQKLALVAKLLTELDSLSAKYVVRIVLGTTRLGFTELTIVNALAHYLGDKSLASVIESKYNIHPDIGVIAQRLKDRGIAGIADLPIELGVPILSQKAQRLIDINEILAKMHGRAWAEYKLDGTRMQLHFSRTKKLDPNETETQNAQQALFDSKHIGYVKTFTRNLEETTHQFPDIVEAVAKQIKADSVILDGEAIAYDKQTGKFLAFQEVIKRKRKYDVAELSKTIPLKFYVFDLLYCDGVSTMDLPLTERRARLEKVFKPGGPLELNGYTIATTHGELAACFEDSKRKNLEGLVVKNPTATYQAGARSFAWIKLKKGATELSTDEFDCVILGYYYGKGVRSTFGIGRFLAGVYDPKTDTYKTLTKVGTGLTDEDWTALKTKIDRLKTNTKPANVEVTKGQIPDIWVTPQLMVVLKAEEITKSPAHTSGYALRFPRFVSYRTDKKPTESTTTDEIEDMYKQKKRGYY